MQGHAPGSRRGQQGYLSGPSSERGKDAIASAWVGQSGPRCHSSVDKAAQRGSPNSSWSSFSSCLLSPTPTGAKNVRTLGSGLPSVSLAKFPLPSHLFSHHSKLTKPNRRLPKPSSTSVGLWSGLGSRLSEADSGGGMVGAWGGAESSWDPEDGAAAGSCCMDLSVVLDSQFDLGGRKKLNENRAPER